MDDTKTPADSSQESLMLTKVKTTFKEDYFPVNEFRPGVIFMSTAEIHDLWQNIYPSATYNSTDIALWLSENDYRFCEAGQMRYEWMLLPATMKKAHP